MSKKAGSERTLIEQFDNPQGKGTTLFYQDGSGKIVGSFQAAQWAGSTNKSYSVTHYDTSVTNGLAGTTYYDNNGDGKVDFAQKWFNPDFKTE